MHPRHERLPALYEIQHDDCEERLAALKSALQEKGVNRRGWKLYLDFGDALIETLGPDYLSDNHRGQSRARATRLLAILAACEMDIPPPPELIAAIPHWRLGRLAELPPMLLRAAWKACLLQQYQNPTAPLTRFVEVEITPVMNWYAEEGKSKVDEKRMKAGWTAIANAYKSRTIRITPPNKTALCQDDEWPIFVRRVEYGGYLFIALSNDQELQREGDAMRHCVATYTDNCRQELVQIYRIFLGKTGVHIATLSVIERQAGLWEVEQVKGNGNQPVDEHLVRAVEAVARAHEDAYRFDVRTRQQINAIRIRQLANAGAATDR